MTPEVVPIVSLIAALAMGGGIAVIVLYTLWEQWRERRRRR